MAQNATLVGEMQEYIGQFRHTWRPIKQAARFASDCQFYMFFIKRHEESDMKAKRRGECENKNFI